MSRQVTLLVVEDSEDDARLAMLALRRAGFDPNWQRVQDAASLHAAIGAQHWDAVFSDFRLPGFTGVDALRIFRDSGLDIPFIFVSGTIGEETAVEAMKAGASDYVMKGNLARLPAVLERELEQASIRAQHRQAQLDLRHAQKMESIGRLAGGIAHDFNNILGAILGNVALARGEVGPGHPALASLDEILKASLRARDLVRQILTFSRREPQELRTQPLAPIIDETQKMLRATLPARVELLVTLPDSSSGAPLHVNADATQLQQVLMNLCTNAWHALTDGAGRICIGLAGVRLLDRDSAHLNLADGSYAHVWVSDTGVGMDAATREHIFEPFFTTKPVGQGTGLGLSVVHGIVAAHHGAVAVDSFPGAGSTFHLYFPAVEPEAADVGTRSAPVRVDGHGEHVLYLDDDETMVVMVERLLQRAGYKVTCFHDAHEALAAVRAQPDAFDFVVTDYNMPDCSGLDVTRELAAIRPGLPIVISSGYITDELRAQAGAAGARGLLEKESTFDQLEDLVGRLLDDARGGTP